MTVGSGDGGSVVASANGSARRRAANRTALLRALRSHGPTTRQDLARHAGLSLTTVASLLAELEPTGLVVQRPMAQGRAGRRPFLVAFDHAAGTALAVDVAERYVAVAVGSRSQQVLAERRIEIPARPGPAAVAHLVCGLSEQVLAEAGCGAETLLGAAVSVGGAVEEPEEGGRGPGRRGGPTADAVARAVRQRWQIPIALESPARLGALAEYAEGPARGARTLLNLTWDRRIDLGIAIGGALHRGSSGSAGRLGHLMVRPGGRPCRCGLRGCLDAYLQEVPLLHDLDRGPTGPRETSVDAVVLLAQALATATLLLDPSAVVLGGSLAGRGEPLADRLTSELGAMLPSDRTPLVVPSVLERRAPLLGGLVLVLSKVRGVERVAAGRANQQMSTPAPEQ
ncbi:ROK family transcriptional regulator [Kitasatospora sp. NPDC048365]|uniref:ROK family transcriptional regulator n=1 Tax=Kitasatospora sp. NPDC048365 TaxID=3364050 RepID=UPI0037204C9F